MDISLYASVILVLVWDYELCIAYIHCTPCIIISELLQR